MFPAVGERQNEEEKADFGSKATSNRPTGAVPRSSLRQKRWNPPVLGRPRRQGSGRPGLKPGPGLAPFGSGLAPSPPPALLQACWWVVFFFCAQNHFQTHIPSTAAGAGGGGGYQGRRSAAGLGQSQRFGAGRGGWSRFGPEPAGIARRFGAQQGFSGWQRRDGPRPGPTSRAARTDEVLMSKAAKFIQKSENRGETPAGAAARPRQVGNTHQVGNTRQCQPLP